MSPLSQYVCNTCLFHYLIILDLQNKPFSSRRLTRRNKKQRMGLLLADPFFANYSLKQKLFDLRSELVQDNEVMSVLSNQVKQNLVYYNLWSNAKEVPIVVSDSKCFVLKALPPSDFSSSSSDSLNFKFSKLQEAEKDSSVGSDGREEYEYILPVDMDDKITMKFLDDCFEQIKISERIASRPNRIILGMVNDDSTIVYYFVHDGIAKPRKN
ncbi:Sen15p ASCRUDRAFT_74692 [Ascoidea rubescens DSM 1968]|uniref:tRNA-splicing endonuclease subunit Sen15 domain-containing protein n=1 Tax=Ascoidea rubescens DSM 1968 TaxID=1344418 RepID=A0A1D2VKZ6_9ASCO|nr:hypothetical protein ASCRUDRAFT_74692 [Ascoidea rubescens DSM 1968]ODV62273.1 hypothetical protein ASCRUDRAFT_74692 [Ascoidea rubescens DSM 1968]